MKRIILPFAFMLLLTTINACSKCGHCDYNGTADNTVCQKDSKAVYEEAVQQCFDYGGKWVSK